MPALVHIEKLTKKYGGQTVLNSVDMDLGAGKIYGIVGNNGSGKTVLLKCICGFVQPTEGYVEVAGKKIGKDTDFPEDTGIIIETPGFRPNLSAYKNLKILASLKGKPDKDAIYDVIRDVGLDPKLKKPVGKYSLGMRQRLGIAQAIMDDPMLLILDEPFNGLDKQGTLEMRKILKDMKDHGKTVIMTSHNQTDIDELCDVVYEMDGGIMITVR